MKIIQKVLPHILFILSGIFITFLVLDEYNPTMDFVSNPVSLKLFWAFCILTLLNSVITIVRNQKKVIERDSEKN